MQTILATLVIFGGVMAAMAIGVIVSGRVLRGSCGGVDSDCSCSKARQRRCAAAAGSSSGAGRSTSSEG